PWFFRLSRYRDAVREVLESGQVCIEPAARRAEVLAFVRGGLADFSASRPAARSDGWGIPVPGDPDQVIYVWWDALTNYVTADPAAWVAADDRIHVIGKGIVRFHAVSWLAILLSAGLPLPTAIYVHDYLTVGGAKLSKSAGAVVEPVDLADRYGTDAVRWWLLREVAPLGDTDFTVQRLIQRADQDLANGLGNLVHRTLTLCRGEVTGVATDLVPDLASQIDRAVAAVNLRAATAAITDAVDVANRYIEAQRPWERPDTRDDVLATLVHAERTIAGELQPFLPTGAVRLSTQLGAGRLVSTPQPAFPRLGREIRPGPPRGTGAS
ncbi:MAG TPA: class I tRNA ligase family protein, partial [Actinoplanes sp.]|nr:class I tRNA ligase family protein [Actinoplanes sp.]